MTHRIYAIRYGHLDRTSDQNFLGGDDHASPMPLDYYVWVIKGGRRAPSWSTRASTGRPRSRGRTLMRPVADGLAAIGVDPSEVQDVVITHMHYDHAGNVPLFPEGALSCAGCRDGLLHRPRHDSSTPVGAVRCGKCRGHGASRFRRTGRVSCRRFRTVSGRDAASPARPHAGAAGGARGDRRAARWCWLRMPSISGPIWSAKLRIRSLRTCRCILSRCAGCAVWHRRSITSFQAMIQECWQRFPAEPGLQDIVRLDLAPVPRAVS